MEIALKFDGVVANSHLVKATIAKERFGIDIPVEQFRREIVLESGLLTREQYEEVDRLVLDGSYPIPMVPGAILYLPLLLGRNSISIIIKNGGEEQIFVNKWLVGHELYDSLIFSAENAFPKRGAYGGLDVYVDDNVAKLLPLMGQVPNLIFFARQCCQSEEEPECITRVSSWVELYEHIWNKVREESKRHQPA
jgi:hypothetical protein